MTSVKLQHLKSVRGLEKNGSIIREIVSIETLEIEEMLPGDLILLEKNIYDLAVQRGPDVGELISQNLRF